RYCQRGLPSSSIWRPGTRSRPKVNQVRLVDAGTAAAESARWVETAANAASSRLTRSRSHPQDRTVEGNRCIVELISIIDCFRCVWDSKRNGGSGKPCEVREAGTLNGEQSNIEY